MYKEHITTPNKFKVLNMRLSSIGLGGIRVEAEVGLGLNLELALVLVQGKYLESFQCLSNYNHMFDANPLGSKLDLTLTLQLDYEFL